jgi:alpha-1,3-rhamnosyl/mannosyltransferase
MTASEDGLSRNALRESALRIVLDGTPLTEETGGIRRYAEELSLALSQAGNGDAVHLVSDQALPTSPRLEAAGVCLHGNAAKGWGRRWWLAGLPRLCGEMGASVFHGTDFAVPYLHRTPAVMTIHDLSPWKQRAWQAEAARVRRRTPWMLRLGLADAVITVSESVRREVLAYFRIAPERVHAIPLAADARFRPLGPVAGAQPYFLFVGTLEPRKNLAALVEAWKPVYREFGVPLKIAGRRRKDFVAPAETPGIEWLGAVADEDLAALYSGALAVVYPSVYEGFGLPVLEAMQCGAPVVVGAAEALREVAGDGAICLGVNESGGLGELSDVLRRFAIDPAWRQEWSGRSIARAAGFSWARTAAETRGVYLEAIRRFERKA